MMYDYKVISSGGGLGSADAKDLTEKLNSESQKGWEPVTQSGDISNGVVIVLKRLHL